MFAFIYIYNFTCSSHSHKENRFAIMSSAGTVLPEEQQLLWINKTVYYLQQTRGDKIYGVIQTKPVKLFDSIPLGKKIKQNQNSSPGIDVLTSTKILSYHQ